MGRYWVSWWTGYYASEGCTAPPFQCWNSGERDRPVGDKTDLSMCAVIDANSPAEIWVVVKHHFPDYEERFCNEVESDWRPNDRFPDFEGKTQLA